MLLLLLLLLLSVQVCLSLLGTWQGPSWEPGVSTLLQVWLLLLLLLLLGLKLGAAAAC
jgi:hypothetical protein